MYFQIGNYQTENNSSWATWTYTSVLSPRGRKVKEIHRINLHTVLISTTQPLLTAAIQAHEAGVRQQNKDLAFYQDDGTITAHRIINSQTENGLTFKGIAYPGYFPGFWGQHTEYAYMRYVVSSHEAHVLDVEDNILQYWQGMRFSIGGAGYKVLEAFTGLPQFQFTKQSSKFWAIQRGFAIGMFINPNPSAPLVNVPPDPDRSWVEPETPITQGRLRNTGFKTSWSYFYESPGPLNAFPPPTP